MGLELNAKFGENEHETYRIRSGLTIDASSADIEIKGLCHRLKTSEDQLGRLYIESANEERALEKSGESFKKIKLLPGLIFNSGGIRFEITDSAGEVQPWISTLQLVLKRLTRLPSAPRQTKAAFSRALFLKILQGKQSGEVWQVGYGPRYVGTDSVDFPIHEFEIGDVGFSIDESPEGLRFSTKHSAKVRLNNRSTSTETLKKGDRIQLGSTTIQVDFDNQ